MQERGGPKPFFALPDKETLDLVNAHRSCLGLHWNDIGPRVQSNRLDRLKLVFEALWLQNDAAVSENDATAVFAAQDVNYNDNKRLVDSQGQGIRPTRVSANEPCRAQLFVLLIIQLIYDGNAIGVVVSLHRGLI